MKRKILAITLSVIMLFSIPTIAFAADNKADSTLSNDIEIMPISTFWDIASLGQYTGSFVGVRSFVDTACYFKPNSSGRLSVKVVSSWKYHEDSSFNPGITIQIKNMSGTVVKSYNFSNSIGTNKYSFTGLSSNSTYYVTVKMRSTDSVGKNTISGTIYVRHSAY